MYYTGDEDDDAGGGFDMPDLGDPVLGLLRVATENEENVMGESVGQIGKLIISVYYTY